MNADIHTLVGAYALDAVDDDERDVLEAHLSGCPRCRAEVAEHREVAARLAHTGAPAPPGLWSRIAGALEEAPPPLALAPVTPGAGSSAATPTARRPSLRWLAAAAAVAAVVASAVGLKVAADTRHLSQRDALARSFVEARNAPRSRTVELRSTDGDRAVEVVLAPDGTGYVSGGALPALPADRTYQLWALVGDARISAGVLGRTLSLRTFPAVGRAAGYAITEETAGGVVTSRQDPLVVGLLSAA